MKNILFLLFLFSALFSSEKKEIAIWHAFEGFLSEKFVEVVETFNQSSDRYEVVPVYKGNYREVFDQGVKAFETGEHPPILQVYEVANHTMLQKTSLFIPLQEIMERYDPLDPSIYIDSVRDFYSFNGKMNSFPWNISTGVLFYNKEAFIKAGLDPETPPKTWRELEEMGKKLVAAGYIGFTTAWPAAYHLEHLCSWHNLPFATHENGFSSPHAKLNFCGFYQIRHLENLVRFQKEGIFSYQGRFTNEPEKLFKEQKCAILLQGSNRYSLLKGDFSMGVGAMPFYEDVALAPYQLNIGGSSFWVLSGFDEDTYRGIARFFTYLSKPQVQSFWHEKTGYLPATKAAYELSKKRGFYKENPAAEVAILEVIEGKKAPYTKGVRLENYTLVREKIIDAIEKALHLELSPKEALMMAQEEGNELLSKKGL